MSTFKGWARQRLPWIDRVPAANRQKIMWALQLRGLAELFGKSFVPSPRLKHGGKTQPGAEPSGARRRDPISPVPIVRRYALDERARSAVATAWRSAAGLRETLYRRQVRPGYGGVIKTLSSAKSQTQLPRLYRAARQPLGRSQMFSVYPPGPNPIATGPETSLTGQPPQGPLVTRLTAPIRLAPAASRPRETIGKLAVRPPISPAGLGSIKTHASQLLPANALPESSELTGDASITRSGGTKNPTGAGEAPINRMATLHIDGNELGRWMVEYFARALARPASGMTGTDPRANPPRGRVAPF